MNKYIVFCFLFLFITLGIYSQQTVCKGTTKTYTVDTADGVSGTSGSTYAWVVSGTGTDYVGAMTGDGTNSITVNWKTSPAGSYTITVIETNNGCPGPQKTLNITIKNNPIITLLPAEVCSGLTTEIVATLTSGNSGGAYAWTIPTGATPPGNVLSFFSGTGGSYTVTYTDSDTCISNIATTTLTINPLPSADIAPVTGTTTTFCAGGNVQLSAPTGLSYVWNKGNIPISPAVITMSYTAFDAGNYTVTTIDEKGCKNITASPTVVTVNPLPIIMVVASGSLEFCNSNSVTLTATPSGATTPYSYQWKNSAIALSGQISASYSASTTENFSVTVTDDKTCFATSNATSVIVHPNPAAIISAATSITFCAGDSVVLSVGSGSNYSYQWKDSSGDITTGTSASYTATESSLYSVNVVDGTYGTSCATTSPAVGVTKKALPVTSIIGY